MYFRVHVVEAFRQIGLQIPTYPSFHLQTKHEVTGELVAFLDLFLNASIIEPENASYKNPFQEHIEHGGPLLLLQVGLEVWLRDFEAVRGLERVQSWLHEEVAMEAMRFDELNADRRGSPRVASL